VSKKTKKKALDGKPNGDNGKPNGDNVSAIKKSLQLQNPKLSRKPQNLPL
jgi:hypothetical protein